MNAASRRSASKADERIGYDVRFRERSRRLVLAARFSGFDPGCVKTLRRSYDFPGDSVGESTRRFVEETDRGQWTLLPECLDDFIDENNPVRVIDVFVDALDSAIRSAISTTARTPASTTAGFAEFP
jgi:hypothetical protein